MMPKAGRGGIDFDWREAAGPENQSIALQRLVHGGGVTELKAFTAILREIVRLDREGQLTPQIVEANWEALIRPALGPAISTAAKGAIPGAISMTRFRERVLLAADSITAISHTLPPQRIEHLLHDDPDQAPPDGATERRLEELIHADTATRLRDAGAEIRSLEQQLGPRPTWSSTTATRNDIAAQVTELAELLDIPLGGTPDLRTRARQSSGWVVELSPAQQEGFAKHFPDTSPVRGSRKKRRRGSTARAALEAF